MSGTTTEATWSEHNCAAPTGRQSFTSRSLLDRRDDGPLAALSRLAERRHQQDTGVVQQRLDPLQDWLRRLDGAAERGHADVIVLALPAGKTVKEEFHKPLFVREDRQLHRRAGRDSGGLLCKAQRHL